MPKVTNFPRYIYPFHAVRNGVVMQVFDDKSAALKAVAYLNDTFGNARLVTTGQKKAVA